MRDGATPYRSLFLAARDAIFLAGPAGEILEVNPEAERLFGYCAADLTTLQLSDLHPTHARRRLVRALEHIAQQGGHRFEIDLRKKSGEVFRGEISASCFEVEGCSLVQGSVRDISDRDRGTARLRRAAERDPLTDLPNRGQLYQRLQVSIDRAGRRADERFALLLVDLDRFTMINEGLGHRIGDGLLLALAHRLADCVQDGDTLAALGGDEFALLAVGINGVIDARQVAEKIEQALATSIVVHGRELYPSISIGIALARPQHRTPDDCLRDADTALRRAKARGGGRTVVFDAGAHGRAVERLELENDLRRATHEQGFVLFFQPIVHLPSGTIHELEALIRWRHPERGLLRPDAFLPLAALTGLSLAIDEHVLHTACRQASDWQLQFRARLPIRVAVNISSRHFTQLELVPRVERVLAESGLRPADLCLEVTESAMIDDFDAAGAVLARLKAMGVRVALDDFGTGYSSLGYLHRFPVDVLKIDRTFVRPTGQSAEIIRAIVYLGHSLGMTVTAEGIETEDDLARIRSLGCEYGQGYHFSRPLDAKATARLLAAQPTW